MGRLTVRARAHTEDLGYYWPNHKPAVSKWFSPHSGENVVDVGANVGYWSLLAGLQGANVLSVEPNPGTFAVLRRNAQVNMFSNIEPINLGLSSHSGSMVLTTGENATGSSSFTPHWVNINSDSARLGVSVPVDTLDHVLDSRQIHWVDWLLIDVEGHELDVLRGATVALSVTKHLILELTYGETEREALGLLGKAGFEVVDRSAQSGINGYWFLSRASGLQLVEAPRRIQG